MLALLMLMLMLPMPLLLLLQVKVLVTLLIDLPFRRLVIELVSVLQSGATIGGGGIDVIISSGCGCGRNSDGGRGCRSRCHFPRLPQVLQIMVRMVMVVLLLRMLLVLLLVLLMRMLLDDAIVVLLIGRCGGRIVLMLMMVLMLCLVMVVLRVLLMVDLLGGGVRFQMTQMLVKQVIVNAEKFHRVGIGLAGRKWMGAFVGETLSIA